MAVDLPCGHTLCVGCLKLRFDVALKMVDGVVCCCGNMLSVEVAEKVVGKKCAAVYRDRIEGGYGGKVSAKTKVKGIVEVGKEKSWKRGWRKVRGVFGGGRVGLVA